MLLIELTLHKQHPYTIGRHLVWLITHIIIRLYELVIVHEILPALQLN